MCLTETCKEDIKFICISLSDPADGFLRTVVSIVTLMWNTKKPS